MNGIILINKPQNFTSRDVVNIISKELNIKKVGHTGTLDPIATGVLVVCIGKATKIVDIITSYDKEYIAEFILGIETDTLDITGEIIKKEEVSISEDKIKRAIESFIGKNIQEVPKYSAVKIKGKKLYEYARNNIEIELPKRSIEIYNIELIEYKENTVKIKCKVSKGTYIRSLIKDIGEKLGTCATMTSLVRTKQGKFNIEDSYTLEDIKNKNYKIFNIEEVLTEYSRIVVDKELEKKIRNGALLDKFFNDNISLVFNEENRLIAIYKVYEKDNTKVKPYIIFNM